MENFQSFIGVDFWNALFTLLNTVALFLVLKKFLFVPVKNMIDARQKEIDDLYLEANSAKEQAQQLQTEYQKKLSAAQQTSETLIKEAVARGQSREEEIIRQANQEAGAILNKAAADVVLEKKKAINDAKDEISGIALSIAGKVVGRQLNETDQAALIDHFIDELGDNV